VEVFQAEGAVPKRNRWCRACRGDAKLSGERPGATLGDRVELGAGKPQEPVEAAEPKIPLVVLEDLMHETLGTPGDSEGS